ncbi:hypothetical protein [Pontibacter sp. SGAir0037]|uniref:hypothetical protein n=1 Tax=Pontibacter sp. SGAir0037 TaxID=2571030 RepID=UPI0010CD08E4|nr:hypothetical protein [Pontibacter sp. SGAir0037]QCR21723.1 hypothetical protein C1N53_04775 [Pontibacter sp. SGAir0037]
MTKKDIYNHRLSFILVLQCLLLLRITVPALHVLAHGTDEVISDTADASALCLISEAASEEKEADKTAQIIQLALTDMLPVPIMQYDFAGEFYTGTIPKGPENDKLISRDLTCITPPPQA